MDKKYKVKVHNPKYSDTKKYSVEIYTDVGYESNLILRDKTENLYPEYYNGVCCTIDDTGSILNIDVEGKKITLDYSQEEYLLAALLCRCKAREDIFKIKEK